IYSNYYNPGYYSNSYYAPGYTYGDTYAYTTPPSTTQSFYTPPANYATAPDTSSGNEVTVDVKVPDPNAEVWFDGSATRQRGTSRTFYSPPVDPNQTYTYDIRARWTENGREQNQTKTVRVRAGDRTRVDFSNADRSDRDERT